MLRHLRASPRVFPLVAAPVLGALGVVEAAADPEFRQSFGVLVVVAVWFAGSFAVAAWWPSAGAVLVACFYPLTAALGAPGPGGTGLIAVMLATGYVGYAAPPRRSTVAVTAAVLVFVVTDISLHGIAWDTVFFPAVFYPARWVGRLVSREQERSAQLVELTALLEAQRETAAQAAAQEERTRIAREVHDAVAHSVSVMTLQIGGLRRQLAGVLAERPQEYDVLLGLERLGRETVEELRSLVGILRESGHAESSTAPVPSLSRAEDVVSDVRAAGLDVELEVVGTPQELPRAFDLSAYRILQEALTNVLRHAPGSRARVVVDWSRDCVDIRVRDDGRGHASSAGLATGGLADGDAGGHGILGMRERAQMFGGTLSAEPVDGGFEVHAHLPTRRIHA
jgi:signal transduction histidine kinase